MKKRVISLLLVLAMVLSFAIPVSAAAMTELDAAVYLMRWAGLTDEQIGDTAEAQAQAAADYGILDGIRNFDPDARCTGFRYERMRRNAVALANRIASGELDETPTEPTVPEETKPAPTEPAPTEPAPNEPITAEIIIYGHPEDLSVSLDEEATLYIDAACSSGADVSLQWYRCEADGSGAAAVGTGDSCDVPTGERGETYYYCMVSAPGAESLRSNICCVDVNASMVFQDGLAQPILNYTSGASASYTNDGSDIVRFCVWVETDYDTDADGKLDLVKAVVQMPRAAMEGDYKAGVIYEARPYIAGTTSLGRTNGGYGSGNYPTDNLYSQPDPRTPVGVSSTADHAADATGSDFYYYENLDWYDYFLVRGYAVVVSAGLGTRGSEGFEVCGTDLEIDAFACVVEWLTGERTGYTDRTSNIAIEADWCSGQVGMTGRSYAGTMAFGVATTGVAGLETVVPVGGIGSWYEYTNCQGVTIRNSYLSYLSAYCASRSQDSDWSSIKPSYYNWLQTVYLEEEALDGDFGDVYVGGDYTLNAHQIQCPALVVHGLNDTNVKPKNFQLMYDSFVEAGCDVKLLLHQDSHVTPAYGANKTEQLINGEAYQQVLNRWFSHYVCDVDNGADEMAAATIQSNVDGSWYTMDSWDVEDYMTISAAPARSISKGSTTLARYVAGNTSYSTVATIDIDQDTTLQGVVEVVVNATPGTAGKNMVLSAMLVDVSDSYFKAFREGTSYVSSYHSNTGEIFEVGGGAEDYSIVTVTQSNVKNKIIARGWIDLANPDAGFHSSSATNAGNASRTAQTYTIYLQPNAYTVQEGHRLALVVYTTDTSISNTRTSSYSVTVNDMTAYIPIQ